MLKFQGLVPKAAGRAWWEAALAKLLSRGMDGASLWLPYPLLRCFLLCQLFALLTLALANLLTQVWGQKSECEWE